MTELAATKRMNMYLAKKQFRLAYKAFLLKNEIRKESGLEFFTMPNLQSKFEK